MATLLSVNLAVPRQNPAASTGITGMTGIDKRPTRETVHVSAPGPRGTGTGSGLTGDQIFDTAHHGGDDQAVYAYAREDLDVWSGELDRVLPNGVFGENLTTLGVDVTDALIGERWRIGSSVTLAVTRPRIPCGTFAAWMAEAHWVKRFSERGWPGAYLRVLTPGEIRAGDPVTVEYRPAHGWTIAAVYRVLTTQRHRLPELAEVDGLPEEIRKRAIEAAQKIGEA